MAGRNKEQAVTSGSSSKPASLATRDESNGERSRRRILAAAEKVFAANGLQGATTARIAKLAGVPTPNVHYYFRTKQDLYRAVLENILEVWLVPLSGLDESSDPVESLSAYVAAKLELSRRHPQAARVFAMEMIGGGTPLRRTIDARIREVIRERTQVFQRWNEAGLTDIRHPEHLMFCLWAMIHNYANFSRHICSVLGHRSLDDDLMAEARETITALVLRGCAARSSSRTSRGASSTGQPAPSKTTS